MLDLTKGYDPTKPLNIELPLGCRENDSLQLEKSEDINNFSIFLNGELLPEKNYQLILRFKKNEKNLLKLDIVPTIFAPLIVNRKALNILKQTCPADFQAFPIVINSTKKEGAHQFVNKDYFLINVIKKVDAIDVEQSEFSLGDKTKPKQRGNLITPKKLRFKANCMGNVHLACDIEITTVHFISQKLFHLFKEADIKGAEFFPDYLSSYDRNNSPDVFKF